MTATQAAKRLGISRNTLYLRVKELKVELVKRGRNSMICEEDIQRIKEVLGKKRQDVSSVVGRNASTSDIGQVGHANDSRQEVIDELRGQNNFLKSQLESEKETSAKLLEQMSEGQQLMLAMQTETMRLRQENSQLKLEHQPPVQTAEPVQSFEEAEESVEAVVDRVDPVVVTHTKTASWSWSALTLVLVGVIGWFVTKQSNDLQMRIAELVSW